ncbi:PspC domain-containing protein [Streptomyces sp. BE20]|uniref:PspC domain-containing protein n=1 Tax=Streptomyces sp. BE20 TaxID=3002525 RepID=UPI002E768DC6|nr:PspC domain-containing protein [Streptomyces sp. BE20]MEE1828834.1 PspC domain-containing protein [Streptomyces sp. BE20]
MTEDPRTEEIEEAGPSAPPAPDRPPLNRTEHHRVVAGVCGGLGRHLDIDPVVFRVVTVVLCLSGGLGLFLYGLAWLIVPTEPVADGKGGSRSGRTELQRVLTGRVDGQSVGAVLLTVIGTGVFFSSMGDGDQLFPLLLLAGLVFLAVRYDPERRRGGRIRGRRRRHGLGGHGGHGHGGPDGHGSHGGPYDRYFPEPEPATGADHRRPHEAEDQEARERHARDRAAGTVPADTPPTGPTGYLWDPRHPERNPYGGAAPAPPYGGATPPPGTPAQPWWQRTDLPQGDPLRKEGGPAVPPPPVTVHRRERSPLGLIGLLLAVGAASAVWSASADGGAALLTGTVLATALLVIGLTLLVGAKFGRARRLVVPGLLLTVALTAVGHSSVSVQNLLGDRTWAVASADELEQKYTLGLGSLRLDLSALDPAGGTLSTTVELGAGDLTVVVPPNVTVTMRTEVGLVDVKVPGAETSSERGSRSYLLHPANGQASKGTLDLTLMVGLGDIKVVQS